MHSQATFSTLLNKVMTLINNKNFFDADRQLNPLINADPKNADLWHLKSVTTHCLGRLVDCETAINKALALDPNHINALSNLAKLQQQNHWYDEAISTHEKILKLSSTAISSLFNLGVLYNKKNNYPKAESYLKQAYKISSTDLNIALAYGQSLLNQDFNEEALVLFNKVLAKQPKHVAALNDKGIALKKLCHWDEAIEVLQFALKQQPEQVEVIKNLASCFTLKGQFYESKSLYLDAISINDQDQDAHHWLNKLLWENKDPEFLDSYRHAIKTNPNATELMFDMGHKLNLAGDYEQAKEVLEQATKINKHHIPSLVELGVVLRELNELESSKEIIEQAFKLDNNNLVAREELGKSYISSDQPLKALQTFNQLIIENPNRQGLLAYKAIALKLMGSAEYDYLCNYDHVLITDIDVPKGYASLKEFNVSLVTALRDYHHAKTNPLDQSLMNGSQTSEKLFDYHVPIIQELRQSFREKTLDFLAKLPNDPNHPVLSKNTGNFVETDSWSVILHNTGFHKNHHHPAGWFSGPYYAQIPEVVIDSPDKQGWVKLGQPGFNMMTKLEPDLIIQPTEGMMVRFPSYFWHGTIPFKSPHERITVPCDIIPKM